jgi:glycosyltransferase involved in cell wall biosynthesis
MKVLHVCVADAACGVGIVARRINAAMRANGIESRLLVASKLTADPSVEPLYTSLPGKAWMRAYPMLERKLLALQHTADDGLRSLSLLPTNALARINGSDADIVQLHWINQATLSVGAIGRIEKPLVWSPHDMWPFSGCEHYEDESNPGRPAKGYSKISRAPRDRALDLDRWNFRRKKKRWAKKDMTIICPSLWLGEMSRTSALFGRYAHHTVPYPIDLDLFRPQDGAAAKRFLAIPPDRFTVGFSGDVADPRKGFDLLRTALTRLPTEIQSRVALALMGSAVAPDGLPAPILVRPLGRLSDEMSLTVFNAGIDLLAAPSRQDNMPLTVVEALACGRPVAAFRIGGMPDMITDQVEGRIVAPFDADAYAEAIRWMLTDSARLRDMGNNARRKAETMFDPARITAQFRAIYADILSRRP